MEIEINLKVKLESPFTFGTGSSGGSTADKALLKNAAGRPIIPGSSLKGRVRQECERIIRALVIPWPTAWHCEPPYPDRMCKGPNFCPVCRIFGSPWHPGPVTFDNLSLAPVSREWRHFRGLEVTQLRSGVGINRKRLTSEENLLYTTEVYTPPSTLFYQGRIWGQVTERREAALLVAGIRSVLTIGGASSRGLGWWCCDLDTIIDNKSISIDALLEEVNQWSS